jgi:hypothetical protein
MEQAAGPPVSYRECDRCAFTETAGSLQTQTYLRLLAGTQLRHRVVCFSAESVTVQIKAIEKTAAGAAQAETVAIQIGALERRIEDLPCYRCWGSTAGRFPR